MEKILISLALTVLLGPGAGHFYLRLFRQGFLLLGATLAAAVFLAIRIARSIQPAAVPAQDTAELLRQFYVNHPQTILYFDVAFAAIWAFALVDAYQKARAQLPPREDALDNDDTEA